MPEAYLDSAGDEVKWALAETRQAADGALSLAHDLLAKDELDLRVGQAFASRTYAELAAVTADLVVEPAAARPPGLARAQGEKPVLRPGPLALTATALYAGVWAFTFLPNWPANPENDPRGGSSCCSPRPHSCTCSSWP